MAMMLRPEDCRDMDELRSLIDRLDHEMVGLLAARAACIDRAVALKSGAGLPARIHDRVEQVVANARAAAADRGLDAGLVETLWREIVEWSIAREERAFADAGRDRR